MSILNRENRQTIPFEPVFINDTTKIIITANPAYINNGFFFSSITNNFNYKF